jgi:hypothetical protein
LLISHLAELILVGVIWSHGNEIQVEVRVDTTARIDDTFGQQTVNHAYFSFRFDTPLRKQVMPQLYEEAMKVGYRFSIHQILMF